MRSLTMVAAATAALTLGLAGQAGATIVNFDDLTGFGVVADGYGGINWEGGWVHTDNQDEPYNPSSPETMIFAANDIGYAEVSFSFDAGVVFNGAFFSGYGADAAFDPIYFNLYSNNVLVHTSGGLNASSTPTFLASGYSGLVDRVGVYGFRQFYVMDDVTYNEVGGGGGGTVPEPATWALMIGGFGLAGASLRRRKTVAA